MTRSRRFVLKCLSMLAGGLSAAARATASTRPAAPVSAATRGRAAGASRPNGPPAERAPAATAAPTAAPTRRVSPTARDSWFDPWVEVHAANFRHNAAEVARRAGGRPILAVIKNNAYGAGLAQAARILEPVAAVWGFAVVKLSEALALRDAGVRKPVLLMGPFTEEELAEAARRQIRPMVYTPVGDALERLAARLQRPVAVHACVDTGMNRVGVRHEEAAPLLRDLAARPGVRVEGVMTTFTEDEEFDHEQLRRFETLCSALRQQGVEFGRRHAASTYPLFQHPDSFLDMVRPGMALFGCYPEQGFREQGVMELRPALSFRARVIYVKRVRAGEGVGYGRAWTAPRDTTIATLPVGHTDGLPRSAAGTARVRIGEESYPLVGSVSASHCMADVGEGSRVRVGDVATIYDTRSGSRPETLSTASGASVYDLLMHLNPLLPRRVIG